MSETNYISSIRLPNSETPYEIRDTSKIPSSEKGAANGVATLDSTGKVPSSQLPENFGIVMYGTTAEWNADLTYVPARGTIIVYSDRGTVTINNTTINVPGIKVGDGNAYLVDLPFVGKDREEAIMTALNTHVNNTDIHVTAEKKQFWDNKLNYSLNNENLIFNTL